MIPQWSLLAAMGCATVGKVGVNTSGLVSLGQLWGSGATPTPQIRPRIRSQWGRSSYLIDPAEVPPRWWQFDETEA